MNPCHRAFWTRTPLALSEVADILIAQQIVSTAEHDIENTHEWLDCALGSGNLTLNVSRKHCDGVPDATEPLVFLLSGDDNGTLSALIDPLARHIEQALQQPISIGMIEYLGGDDFAYRPELD